MGFFRKKINPEKDYNMSEVLEILKQPQYKDDTSIYQGKGIYHIILVEESRKIERQIRSEQIAKNSFYERIDVRGKHISQETAEIIDFNEYRRNNYEEREIG